MPIYEYTCQDCGTQFEKLVRSLTAPVEVTCPECGGTHVKKGWSIFGTGKRDSAAGFTASGASCGPAST